MENHQILLLQLIVATFEGDAYCERLVQEADRLILDFADPQDPVPLSEEDSLTLDIPNLLGEVKLSRTPAQVSLPDKLALLAAMEAGPRCSGCFTPGAPKDENGNCEICGYPALG